jgi:ubiquinone/menaquinone biosynthesis C-methylase UbiE
VAKSAAGKFSYPTGKEGASALGYDPALIDEIHPGLLESFCGVGNPFSLFPIQPGSIILDVGCGAGFDLYVAARLTGPRGRVHGVDLTEAMVERARDNLQKAGIANAEVQQVESESLPFAANTFDVVISNGVINLSPDKETLFREINRVLKPGGRFGFADVMLEQELPQGMAGSTEAWSQ